MLNCGAKPDLIMAVNCVVFFFSLNDINNMRVRCAVG